MDGSWNIAMLHYLFLVLLVAEVCVMDRDFGAFDPVSSSKSSLSSPQPQVPFHGHVEPIEIVGPRDFQALSGDLIVWTRLSPLVFNLSGRLEDESSSLGRLEVQLTLLREGGGMDILETLPTSLSMSWHKVSFLCNLVVQGGEYSVRVVRSEEVLSNVTISITYPTIVFEVPHRIEAYTTSTPITFGLTRSTSCEPKVPLPRTVLTLSLCTSTSPLRKTESLDNDEEYDNDKEDIECNRDFASIFDNPLQALQKEGRITTSVECHLWGRNATFRVQLKEEGSKSVIAKSRPIRVEWGSQFSINMSKATVMPCRNSIRVVVSYPSCVLPGRDKIRVYGHETLSVPSLLVPSRLSYIGEQQIRPNNRVVTFRCNLFPQRFLRFCFQYINTAVDDSVAVVVEKCIPTNPPLRLSDGGWGPWSSWTPCTVTCGADGKQYRYRFCDNPPPSSGANFCQGEAIDERRCDNPQPECPGATSVVYVGESLNPPPQTPPEPPPDFHHIQANMTQGCECGCILYDLVPGRNDTLVIFISSNHSSPCADEDEVDHHKLKWILQAKEEKDRVRLEIVEMDLQCVTITFRDGNTTDSNLLQMITSHDAGDQEEHFHYDEGGGGGGGWRRGREEVNLYENLTVESTGASLSIATASDQNKNCSGQFIYFIAYYSTLTLANSSGLLEPVGTAVVALVSYEGWTFLVLKMILLFFLVVVVLSGFGGCLTKVYKKEKYKELKCFDNEDEGSVVGGGGEVGGGGGGEDDSSRCTSVTLMSFDYSYWRRLRILRLKYFLLRPRPLEYLSTRVKSFPTTPTHSRVLVKKKVKEGEKKKMKGGGEVSGGEGLVRSVSLSETNLRVKESLDEKRRSVEEPTKSGGGGDEGKGRMTKTIYCMDPLGSGARVMRTATTVKDCSSVSISLNGSERSSNSTPTNASTSTLSEKGGGGVRQSEKLLKEQENAKRRASGDRVTTKEVSRRRRRKDVEGNNKLRGHHQEGLVKKDIGKSELSVSTTQGSVRCSEDESRVGSRAEMEDADHDFEMDYYDYDVGNAGTIPGSYLGLEPAFVLWNSEVYPGVDEGGEDEMLPCRSSSGGGTSSHDEDGMEMTTTPATTSHSGSTSLGVFSDLVYSSGSSGSVVGLKKMMRKDEVTVKETSLDTLKFADEDSDDNATQASDSIFDNEHDLINDPHHSPTSCS